MKKKTNIDEVDTLLSNEKVSTPPVGFKHMDPTITKDAKTEKKNKPDWPGDCLKLDKARLEKASLPKDSYLVVKRVGGSPNYSACVYDPIHWIYGWGETTMEAVDDCIENIAEWRRNNKSLIDDVISGWQERVKSYGHPLKVDVTKEKPRKKISSVAVATDVEQVDDGDKSIEDILNNIGM